MQVFKLYFQIFRKYQSKITMYIAIFCGVVFGAVIPARQKSEDTGYVDMQCKYAIYDEDKSVLSTKLDSYLDLVHDKKEISDFEIETIQDELYCRNIRAAVVIKKGFQNAFLNGNAADYLIVYDVPDNTASKLFVSNVNEYLENVNTYTQNGVSIDEATVRAINVMDRSSKMEMASGDAVTQRSTLYYFFLYMPWIMVVMMVEALTPVLIRLDGEEVRKRIFCSSYKFSNINVETGLAISVTGLGICGILIALSAIICGTDGVNYVGLFYINMLLMMLIAISLTFLISKIVKSEMVISMIGNIVSLGMAFLTGVFVPMEFLGAGVIKIAHFLPSYWYVKALDYIEAGTKAGAKDAFGCFGIELLFAVAFFLVGMIIANKKRTID